MDDAEFRASVVGAAEVAALFDASPWVTRYELYHRKRGTIATPEFNAIREDGTPENERVLWGVELEAVIVKEACRRWGYEPLDVEHRLTNGRGLGGHPDKLVTDKGEKVVLEVKMVDWLEFKKWGDEPPTHYLLQNMTYQGLAGCVRGDMIVLVGGNRLERFQYPFRAVLYAEIERRAEQFWQDVRGCNEPPVDYARDGDTLMEVIGSPDDSVADLREDDHADSLASDWLAARERRDAAVKDMDIAKAKLIELAGTAGRVLLPSHTIGCNETKGSAGTLITADMVGATLGARKGYRRFDVKEKTK